VRSTWKVHQGQMGGGRGLLARVAQRWALRKSALIREMAASGMPLGRWRIPR
jgi:hypothetical protein